MKVYAHYLWSERDKFQYRWRTLLQFGNSWNVIGSVVMKNPGSAKPQNEVNNEETLRQLSCFDQRPYPWHVFSVDNTMRLIERLFTIKNGGNPLDGVVQIFNLFNIRNADLEQALKDGKSAKESVYSTIEEDIAAMRISPASVYIGWGALGNLPEFKQQANQYFAFIKDDMKQDYLWDDFSRNLFYHPQYLLGRGKNKKPSMWLLNAFCANSTDVGANPVNIPFSSIDAEQIMEIVKNQTDAIHWYEKHRYQFYKGLQVTFDKKTINIRFVERSGKKTYTPCDYQEEAFQKATKILLDEFGYAGPEKSWIIRKEYSSFGADTIGISCGIMKELASISSILKKNSVSL